MSTLSQPSADHPDEAAQRVPEAARSIEVIRSLADALPTLVSFVDAEQRFRYCNKAYERRFGRPLAEIIGRPLWEIMSPAVYADRLPWIRRALAGEAVSYEAMFPHPDGDIATHVQHMPHRDAAGVVIGFYNLVTDVTEQRRLEAEREEEAARLRALTDNIPLAMIYQAVTSPDLGTRRYTYVSGNCEALAGVPAADVLADAASLMRLIAPESRQALSLAEAEAARTLRTLDIEIEGAAPDGQYRRARVIANPRPGLDGTIVWDGLLVDRTAAHKAADALAESESRFRRIADSAPIPMWVTRLDRTREFANKAYVEFLGVGYEDALRFDWRTIIHPDDVARIYLEQAEKEASLRPFTLEARYRKADGAWCWLRSESQPRFGPGGEHQGFIGAAYDVTEARATQAALEERVAERTVELETLYRKAPVPLHSQSPEGLMVSVSDRWLEFMGYERRDQVLGRSATEFLTDDTRRRHLAEYWPKLLAQGYADDVEYQVVKRSGEVADVLISSRLARDADGRFLRTMGAVVDVTARKQAEAQLRQAQKLEAIGQLTGGVAHDFNNLLTPVIGSLDLLQSRLADDPRATRLVHAAMQGAERAATLVQRLLAFARRQGLRPQPTDVAALVDGMRELIDRSLGPDITVQVVAAPALAAAMVDPNQLELALLNLVVNARDAMPNGGSLCIDADEQVVAPEEAHPLPAGGYVRLAVADTGAGMDDATLRRAVEPFFSTKETGKGTGLGLSMVHGLAAQSGGRLLLRSQIGRGTRAELWLPVANAAAAPVDSRFADTSPLANAPAVLLVDDEALVRTAVAELLTDLGCTVVEADSGEAALRLLRGGATVDLIVTDYLMPGIRGSALAAEARKLRPGLPVLLVTGFADLDDSTDASLPRLAKPLRRAELAETLRRLTAPPPAA